MKRPTSSQLVFFALSLSCAGSARPAYADTEVPGAYRFHRAIVVDKVGPQRLEVDLELLSGAASGLGLADLRLYDGAGHELPYLLLPPEQPGDQWQETKQIVSTPPTRERSGFEADLGSSRTVDRLRIAGLLPPVMKRISLEAAADHAHFNLLASDETVFDLPDRGLVHLEVDFPPGQYRYLRASWDDRATSPVPLPRSVAARLSQPRSAARPVVEPVEFEKRSRQRGMSCYRIRLPAKALPIAALSLEVAETELHRPARIAEPRLSGRTLEPTILGRAVLKRQSRGDLSASELRIPIERPMSAELELLVDDGDNPPLELTGVRAVLAPQPFVYFETKDTVPVDARFGNPKARAPKYDLEVARSVLPAHPSRARWQGAKLEHPSASPASSVAPVSSVLLRGASLDTRAFGYRRALSPGRGGLASVRFDAAVLAHSPTLADIRIIDAHDRQVPYLLEKEQEPLVIDVTLEAPLPSDLASLPPRRSYHRVRLPYATLPEAHLELTTPVRVFARKLSIWSEVRERARRGNGSRWNMAEERTFQHLDSNTPAPPIWARLPATEEIIVGIEDGDNEALPLASASVVTNSYRLRFFREADAPLALVYGSPGLPPPQYDLALLETELEGAAASETTMGPEQQLMASGTAGSERQSRWFWAVFGVAIVGLLALIARLVRKVDT